MVGGAQQPVEHGTSREGPIDRCQLVTRNLTFWRCASANENSPQLPNREILTGLARLFEVASNSGTFLACGNSLEL